MIHEHDHETLLRILRVEAIPEAVAAEYEIRQSMFHRGGASGPLGVMALVDLARHLGLAPEPDPEQAAVADWRKVPADGTARVEAQFFGEWVPGAFLGFVEGGTVAVRLDGDDLVRECRPGMLRLGGPPFPEPADDAAPVAEQDEEKPVPDAGEPADDAVPVAEQDEEKPVLDAGETPDWEAVPVGTVVYLDLNGETAEGKLVGYEDDVVSVDVDGTVRRVPADDVFLTV